MFTFEWKPKDEEASKFDGHVVVKVPSHMERLAFLKTIGASVNSAGTMVEDGQMDLTIRLVEYAQKHIDKVNLIRKSDKYVVPSVDWLSYDIDGGTILGEIGLSLINGVSLGKS